MLRLEGLNSPQLTAVTTCSGPLLILAGAGSGKTRVITYKIAYLIEHEEFIPSSILAVTFTKKAAGEMLERVQKILGPEHSKSQFHIGTFHSFGANLIRRHAKVLGFESSFSIYDSDDQLSIIKAILKDMNVSANIKPNIVHEKISQAKNKGIQADDYFSNSYGDHVDEIVSRTYREYSKRLRMQNAVDFDDLLSLTVKLLENPEVLKRYQQQFRYILVDEYQDTNTEQYKIVRALAKEHRNLCVVGDEDQSIYSWRGATADNIRYFQKDFPEHKIIKLEQNYRSTKVILDAANNIISKNPNRIPKALWTDKSDATPITITRLEDPFMESMFVLRELDKYRENLDEVAVLYRVNSLSRAFEELFVRYNIPYKLVGGVGFYQRMEIKDVLAYIKFLNNPKDEVSLLRIINTPSRKIGEAAIKNLRETAKEVSLTLPDFVWYSALIHQNKELSVIMLSDDLAEKIREKSSPFVQKYSSLFVQLGELLELSFDPDKPVSELVEKTINVTNYKDWISKMSSTAEEQISRIANIQELVGVAGRKGYKGREGLQLFLEDTALIEETRESEAENAAVKGRVQLMTIHAAKGLEFDTVFIVGLEEGIFPHNRSLEQPAQLQEERRLFYVAVTRAKRNLYLSGVRRRQFGMMSMDSVQSQFLNDIPTRLRVEV